MMGAFVLPLLSFWGAYGKGKRTWRAVPGWMKYLGFVVAYFAAFTALPFFHHHRMGGTRPDVAYQLAAYFGAIEILYARLRSDSQAEDYRQHGFSSGIKIG